MNTMPWWRLIPSIGWAIIAIVAIIYLECNGQQRLLENKVSNPPTPIESVSVDAQ